MNSLIGFRMVTFLRQTEQLGKDLLHSLVVPFILPEHVSSTFCLFLLRLALLNSYLKLWIVMFTANVLLQKWHLA